ncbi:ATP-binding cassette domain-containing protein [Pseudomonas sp. nanlin1]|uniref:ATP-binding cassette domain-containing protein n=1 Tax=Pseudomonas sp. nanlin1 TaxID=3040605 RepID=UPI003890141E
MITFLKNALTQHKKLCASTLFMVTALKTSALAPALILGAVIDGLGSETLDSAATLTLLVTSLFGAVILQSIVNPIQTYCLARLVQQTVKEQAIRWCHALLGKTFDAFNSLSLGPLIKSLDRGISAHEQLLSFFVTVAFPLLIETCLVAIVFVYKGGVTLFTGLVITSVVYLGVCHRLIQWRRPHIDQANTAEDVLAGKLFSTFNAGKSIKLENAISSACEPLNRAFDHYAAAAIKVASSAAVLSSAKILFIGLSTAVLLAWGVSDQLTGAPQLTIGELVAVVSLAGGFLANVSGVAEAYRLADQFYADKYRLQQMLDLAEVGSATPSPLLPHRAPHTLSLPAGTLDGGILVLTEGLSFSSHESVAIVGASGAGKSTLLESLAGVRMATGASALLNGLALSALGAEQQLEALRYCPQAPEFLPGPFDHAVLYGRQRNPTLDAAIDKLMLGHLSQASCVHDGASQLSGGEAKRLSLLRLINRPGLFNLFDEPTASLDRPSAESTWDLLFSTFAGLGLICVTHDLDALKRFDRIVLVDQGRVAAQGTWQCIKPLLESFDSKPLAALLEPHTGKR